MNEPTGRYASLTQRLVDAVLRTPGDAPVELRRAALARARSDGSAGDSLPAPLAAYVDTVARHAYQVTDADVAGLVRVVGSEDAVFELTVSAALGAALA